MKTLTVALPLLLTLPLACGGAVESDSSKNDGVVGVAGDPDADDAGTTGSSVDGYEPDSNEPDSNEPDSNDEPSSDPDDGVKHWTDGGLDVVRLPAIAQTRAQLELLWAADDAESDTGTATATSGGNFPELDPDDLFLKVSDLGAVCSEPHIALSCGGHWSFSIALPPVYQAVGVYDLADPLIAQYSSMAETGELYSPEPDDCSWGGGSFIGGGSIEVLAIDESAVRFRIDIDDPTFPTDPSGVYTAVLCQ